MDPTEYLEGTVTAEDAPTGILLWPVRNPRYAPNYTLAQVIAHTDDPSRLWVEWIYENGERRTFNKGEDVIVRVAADCGFTPKPFDT